MKKVIVFNSTENLLKQAEKQLIRHALNACEGNRTEASKMLGVSIRTLRNKLNFYPKIKEDFPARQNQSVTYDIPKLLKEFTEDRKLLSHVAKDNDMSPTTVQKILLDKMGYKDYDKQVRFNRYINSKVYQRRKEQGASVTQSDFK